MKVLGDFTLPSILYKYRDWGNKFHRELLTKQIAYFSSPGDFNDPFDCKIPIRYDIDPDKQLEDIYARTIKAGYPNASEEKIRSFSKQRVIEGAHIPLLNSKSFKKNDTEYFEKLNKRMGIFSLSKHNDDILMWGHYANSHKGICVGFNTSELLKEDSFDFIGKVEYCSEFPTILPNKGSEYTFQQQIFCKWDKWSYEDEFRLTKNHIPKRKIKFSPNCFCEIIFGYQLEKRERENIVKFTKKRLPHVEFFEAHPNEEKYLIEINRIE